MYTEVHIVEIELTADGKGIKGFSYEEKDGLPPMHEPECDDFWSPEFDVKSDPLYDLAADEGSTFVGTARDREIWETIMVKKYGFPSIGERWDI